MRRFALVVLVATTACSRAGATGANPVVVIRDDTSIPAATTSTASQTTPSSPRATTGPAPPSADPTTTSTTSTSTTSTSTSSTSTSTTSTTEPALPRTIAMAFTGDTLPHSPLWRRAALNAEPTDGYDFRPMLAGLAPLLSEVDLAVCHLETPIVPHGEELSTNPYYGVPVEIVDAIADSGYDRCSTASNHAADRGVLGVDRTVEALEAAGLGQSGMARQPEEIEPSVFDLDGVGVSHLSYTFSYNGLRFPAGQEWRSAVIDPLRIIADVRTVRELGADIVIVSMHWGAEGVHEPTEWQRRIAGEITSEGTIDLVVGHHAHVVQPIELVNDTWVMYGLGNILSNLPTSRSWPAASQDAVVVTVEITVDRSGRASVSRPTASATWVDKDAGWVVRLVDDELARSDIGDRQRVRLEESRARTERVLGPFMVASG